MTNQMDANSSEKYVPKYPVLTLEKALDILTHIQKNAGTEGVGISELCRDLGIKKSSAHRILDTLYARNYVEKNNHNNKYKLGWALHQMGNDVPEQHSLSEDLCAPILEELCGKYQESFSIGIYENNHVVTAFIAEPDISQKASFFQGEKLPLYATSKGKLFLSQMSENKIYDFYREFKVIPYTTTTLATPRKMLLELQQISVQGYATDCEEHCEGFSCISFPIRNHAGDVIAGFSASGPTERILPKMETGLKEDLLRASKYISNKMGYIDF